MSSGYFTAGRFYGVPLRLHWSLPLGMLLASGGRPAPGIWLGYLLIVLLHEAGHAVLVKRRGLSVLAIDVHALGGLCRWQGSATSADVAIIAWGGVLAQAALFLAMTILTRFVSFHGGFLLDLAYVLTVTNLYVMALNLIPVRPFDGAEAWSIFRHLDALKPHARAPRVSVAPVIPIREARSSKPVEGDIQKEMERIVREATNARRRSSGRNDLN